MIKKNTNMNGLLVHITLHGLELPFALRKFIEKKISRVSRVAGGILSAEVVLREKSGANGLFSVSARLSLTGRDIHGSAVHENFYAAINQLVARLARLSRKRKTRLEKRIRRADRFQFAAKTSTLNPQRQHRGRKSENRSGRSLMSLSPRVAGV